MKRFRIALISLFILTFCLSAVLTAEAKGKARPSSGDAYRREFYRGLSKRLGKKRADYPHLTDEEFANFRAVSTAGMGKGKLYRASSPISPWGSRNLIADNAARIAGIKTFVNLADTEKSLRSNKGFQNSYYSAQNIICLNLNLKFQSDAFRRKLAKGLRLMARSQPPFLVHCSLGKDRAGFVCAVLEALMGASAEEITADYLVSFYNYFGIRPHTKEYELVAHNEIRSSLAAAFAVKNISKVNLATAAERYLLRIGVPAADIEALRRKLGPEH